MDKVQLINFVISFIMILKNLIVYAIIARVLSSWFTMGQMGGRGRIVQFLHDVTDPFVNAAKKLPHSLGMLDFSPIIAMFGVDLLGQLIVILLAKLI